MCVCLCVCAYTAVSDNMFTVSQLRVLSWILYSKLIQACSTIQVSLTVSVLIELDMLDIKL